MRVLTVAMAPRQYVICNSIATFTHIEQQFSITGNMEEDAICSRFVALVCTLFYMTWHRLQTSRFLELHAHLARQFGCWPVRLVVPTPHCRAGLADQGEVCLHCDSLVRRRGTRRAGLFTSWFRCLVSGNCVIYDVYIDDGSLSHRARLCNDIFCKGNCSYYNWSS